MHSLQVRDLGEFGLIGRIAGFLPPSPSNVVVGIGDDVAVLDVSGPEYLLATCDIQVEDVHFIRSAIPAYSLGRKIAAINISDIAATGGTPSWALVSLAIPPDTEVSFVDELYRGMGDELQGTGAAIVGGNVSRNHSVIAVDFFLLGKVAPSRMILRSGAMAGDLVLVTGSLGDSRAGLEVVRRPDLPVLDEHRRYVLTRHFTPHARLIEGQILGRSGMVHAMADISDGLLSDLQHICHASRVGAEVWVTDLPIGTESMEVAREAREDVYRWALTGGEDYELLFTAAEYHVEEIRRMLSEQAATECHVIGRILTKESGIMLHLPDGRKLPVESLPTGWDHLADKSNWKE